MFIVMGDPCKDAAKLAATSFVDPFSKSSVTLKESAPEVSCTTDAQGVSKLEGAYLSDGGHVILGKFPTVSSSFESMIPKATGDFGNIYRVGTTTFQSQD